MHELVRLWRAVEKSYVTLSQCRRNWGVQPHPLANIFCVKLIRFGQTWIKFGQNQNLVSLKHSVPTAVLSVDPGFKFAFPPPR